MSGALRAFSAYGYRKTSMNDIAAAAGMSRPALYQHYKNKDDIFRGLVCLYYDHVVCDLEAVFEKQRPVRDTLKAAFSAHLSELFQEMLKSAHGMELLDSGVKNAADIKEEGERQLRGLYAEWLGRETRAGTIHLTEAPEIVADVILTALKALKMTETDMHALNTKLDVLADLTGKGLQGSHS